MTQLYDHCDKTARNDFVLRKFLAPESVQTPVNQRETPAHRREVFKLEDVDAQHAIKSFWLKKEEPIGVYCGRGGISLWHNCSES